MASSCFKVAIIDKQFVDQEYITDIESEVLKGLASVECFGALKAEEVPDSISEVDAVLSWHHITNIGGELMDKMKKTKVIVRIGMGYDNVDCHQAAKMGIKVCNVPDYGIEIFVKKFWPRSANLDQEVADSTMCFLLNIMRRTHWLANGTKAGKWNTKDTKGATRLNGRVLGLIGIGRIGTAVALRAKAFNLKVIYYDPYVEHGRLKSLGLDGQVYSLEELLQQSDIVSVHCPLTHNGVSNKHLLNQNNIQKMKKGAALINTARGPIVEEEAVLEGLKSGILSAVALDVFEKEPYTSGGLLEHPNVITTPHSAFYSDQGLVEMRTKAALEAKRVLQGEIPFYWVNKTQWLQYNKQ